jgi:hypothetical protein
MRERRRRVERGEMTRMWMGKKIKIKGVFAYIHEHQKGMDLSGTT